MMHLSDAGLAAIKRHEGLRLDAYPDPGSKDGLPVTIGHGSTRTLTGKPWKLGDRITEAEADALLLRDIDEYEAAVNRLVSVPMTPAMFDALVSLTMNIGAGAFGGSTLLRELNAGNYTGAQAQFQRWRMNDGKVMQGLVSRRAAEAAMFASQGLNPAAQAPITAPDVSAPAPETIAAPEPIYRPDDALAAPIVESVPVYVAPEKPMNPFLAIALPELIKRIPELIRTFGDGEVTERNARAAEALVGAVVASTGAKNAQEAIETIDADPGALAATREVLQRDAWFEPTEAGDGVAGAREFNRRIAESNIHPLRLPVVWVSLALMGLIYMVTAAVLFVPGFSNDIKTIVITAIIVSSLGTMLAFWFGIVNKHPGGQS